MADQLENFKKKIQKISRKMSENFRNYFRKSLKIREILRKFSKNISENFENCVGKHFNF